ncbi:MAG: DNA polymerase III subunit beta [Acidobacteria bacterium]|nr:DNA polymerase III subunit beta [Acidobacteriota bacterium]
MELVVKQPDILRELELLQGVVERKNTVPILSHLLLSITGEGLEVMGTDLEVSVRSRSSVTVNKEGAVCVAAKKLYEIIRLLPEKDVLIKSDAENWVSVVCDRSRFRIMGLPKEDFPTLPVAGKASKIKIPGPTLKKLIERVIFAVTSDDARFALNGALMILKDRTITLVSTDSHRLCHATETTDMKGPAEEERALVPRKALTELMRLGHGLDGDVYFTRKENNLFFEVGNAVLTSRVLEGTFPNFEKVIPVGNDKIVEFDRKELATALNRVSLLANERSRAVRLAVKDGAAEFSSKNPEMGEASEAVEVAFKGDPIEIGFNAKYLVDFLAIVDTDRVQIELKDDVTQGVLRPAGEESRNYTYVVMPMRL